MNYKPIIISIIVPLLVAFVFPVCIITILGLSSVGAYYMMSSICDSSDALIMYNKFTYKIPVSNAICLLSQLFVDKSQWHMMLMILGGLILLTIIIIMVIAMFSYMSSYMCLIYHFSEDSKFRTRSWFNCLKLGSYTLCRVWKENTFKSIIILIPNVAMYILFIMYENIFTLCVWLFTMFIFPTVIITLECIINSHKHRNQKINNLVDAFETKQENVYVEMSEITPI